MNVEELAKLLKKKKVPEDAYSLLKGGLPNEMLCLVHENNQWCIYYSERGLKSGETFFRSESEACEYFYDHLKQYSA